MFHLFKQKNNGVFLLLGMLWNLPSLRGQETWNIDAMGDTSVAFLTEYHGVGPFIPFMSDMISKILFFSQPNWAPLGSENFIQVLVVILLNTLIQEIKMGARALWKKACVWFWKGKVSLLQKAKIIPHTPFCCLRLPFSLQGVTVLQQGFEYLCNLIIYVDIYAN